MTTTQPVPQGRNHQQSMNGVTSHAGVTNQAFADRAKQDSADTLSLSEDEQNLLSLYDHLHELELEVALLQSQNVAISEADTLLSDEQVEHQVKILERECLEARSTYLVKGTIVENILQANPTLKSVHSGTNATPTEKYMYSGFALPSPKLTSHIRALHPLLDQRDILSIAHANLSANLQSTLIALSSAELQYITCITKNRELANTMLDLDHRLKMQNIEEISDPDVRAQLHGLCVDTREVKGRWRIMKSVLAAMIAGSGIDWARDDDLRDLVLDDES